MAETTHRKLAAVMAADVVSYSRLMGEDEASTLMEQQPFSPARGPSLVSYCAGRTKLSLLS
jgi:hypothetical protein